jgi:EmrB/QacA subfamily drug resistance transporter
MDTQPEPHHSFDQSQIMPIMIGLMLGMLLGALDQTIVATALPTIGHALHDEANLPWVVTAYLLAAVAVTPLYGKLSDIYGRRIIMLIAIGLFILGSIACALAPNMLTLALARGLQGAGGGGLISLAQTIIADIVAPRDRGRYQVHIASVFATSSLAGPVLGGFLSEHVHWTAIFWINIPLGILAFLIVNRRLAALPIPARKHRLDVLGSVLLIVASTALLLALSWGGVRYPWNSAEIFGLGVAAVVFGALFGWRITTTPEPLIPLTVLADPVVKTATLSAGFSMGTFIGLSIFMPIYMQTVLGLSASQSGIALVPLMLGTVVGATISGRLMSHLEHYKLPPMLGLIAAFVATMILAIVPKNLPFSLLEVLLTLISLGLGTVLPTSTIAIQNAVERHHLGTATATSNFFRSIGGALIVAVFGSIVFGMAEHGHAETGHSLSGMDPALLVTAFSRVFLAAGACIAISFLFFVAMPERPLRGADDKKALSREARQPGE